MSSKSVESHGADLETSPTEIMKPRFPAHTAPKKRGDGMNLQNVQANLTIVVDVGVEHLRRSAEKGRAKER